MTTITLTSKGQVTLPAAARRALGLKSSEKLDVDIDIEHQTLTLKRPMTLEKMTTNARKHLKPDTKPVENVDEYYQKHRKPRL